MIPGHKPGLRRLAATLLTAAAGVFASGVALAAYPDNLSASWSAFPPAEPPT